MSENFDADPWMLAPMVIPRMHFTNVACVYVCRNADGEVIYVGQTGDWKSRRTSHRRKSEWWCEVADVRLRIVNDPYRRLGIELALIAELSPRHNKSRSI